MPLFLWFSKMRSSNGLLESYSRTQNGVILEISLWTELCSHTYTALKVSLSGLQKKHISIKTVLEILNPIS